MKHSVMSPLLVVVCVVLGCVLSAHPQSADRGCSSCSVAEQVLHDLEQVRAGMTRQELDKNFVLDGGMVFRNHTVYVSRKCAYMKVAVDFIPDSAIDRDLSPSDKIKGVSQIFVGYPGRD